MATYTGRIDADHIRHDVPLQPDGRWVTLWAPRDITTDEAKRLCGFIQCLAFDSEAER